MLQVNIVLASGRSENLSIEQSSKVGDLKSLAQNCFARGRLRLLAADGRALLDLSQSLQDAGLQEGDTLTAIAREAKIAATHRAFAFWCLGEDRIVTWGSPDCGGTAPQPGGCCEIRRRYGPTSRHLQRWEMDLL